MTTMYDADAQELVGKAAEELKKVQEIKAPSWSMFVKTGMHKERPPVNSDWWYLRAASVLRAVYRLGPVGVSKLRLKYGGKKNRGVQKEHFYKGSGNILRKSLQQLEKAGFVKFAEKGVHKGRVITPKGKSFLDRIAAQIHSIKPKQEVMSAEKEEAKKEAAEAKQEKFIKNFEEKKEIAEIKQEMKVEEKPELRKELVEVKQEQTSLEKAADKQ